MDKMYWRCYASREEQEEYEYKCKADNTTPCTCPGDGSCSGCKQSDGKECQRGQK